MTYLIIGGALAFALFLLRIPSMLGRRRVTKKVHADYARCRGTIHARQLHAGIRKHEASIPPLVQKRDKITAMLESLSRTQVQDLRRALAAALVNGPLAEVRGIGPKLRDRIVASCFDGTLESLGKAQHVQGVGAEKAVDIQAWVKDLQGRLPQLLKSDFEGKADVLLAYGQRREALLAQKRQLDQLINARRELVTLVKAKLAPLESVTPSTYKAALKGDEKAAERVAAHTVGVYAEWESKPAWFERISSDPEDVPDEV